PRGVLGQERLEGSDSGAVDDHLLHTGVTPIDIQMSGTREATPRLPGRFFAPPITLVEVMLFSRQMYTLLKAGVPILRALGGLHESASNPSLKAVIDDLRGSLDSGRELSASMRRHPKVFTSFYVSLVRIGE